MASRPDLYLGPLHTDPKRLKREATVRRKVIDEITVRTDQVQEYVAEGWELGTALKRTGKTKIRREKDIHERLENRLWMLLFRLGYPEISSGRNFGIRVERRGAEPTLHPIAVFAKDDETVIVACAIAASRIARRNLAKEVDQLAELKGPISRSIHNHYGSAFKPKIIWLLVTENIIWSVKDRERAAEQNIRSITERELRYYVQIAEHLGRAARFQFLAEFLKDQPIPELAGQVVPALRGRLGGKRFYCFLTTPGHLLKIAFVNHRSLNDPDGAPSYQRLISRSRLRELGQFVTKGGFFPNSILVNFVRPIRFDRISTNELAGVTFGTLHLPDRYRSCWIIDGQHRLYGFSQSPITLLDQSIIVVAFEQLEKAEEANLFVTINHEQRPVPKHLLDDLEGELKWGSSVPSERVGAISARLINVLNTDTGEPFYNRITQQGIRSTNKTCLTIPALKDALRRSSLLGRSILKDSSYEPGPLCGATDGATLDRARQALNQYFSLIRNANLAQWERGREGNLCTNVGIQAYIILLSSVVRYWEANTASDSRSMNVEDILAGSEEYLAPIVDFLEQADSAQMETYFQVRFGSGGPPEYYYKLCRLVKARFPDFQPEGLQDWEAEQSEERIRDTDQKLKELSSKVQQYIFTVFRSVHTEVDNGYWEKGIPDKKIKVAAYERSQEYPIEERSPLESYLDFIDYKKIVEHRQNWPLLKPVFDIPEEGDKGKAKNLKWMDRVNQLRRVSAHPGEKRHYKLEDFEYVDFIHSEFMRRLIEAEKNLELLFEVDTEPSDD